MQHSFNVVFLLQVLLYDCLFMNLNGLKKFSYLKNPVNTIKNHPDGELDVPISLPEAIDNEFHDQAILQSNIDDPEAKLLEEEVSYNYDANLELEARHKAGNPFYTEEGVDGAQL